MFTPYSRITTSCHLHNQESVLSDLSQYNYDGTQEDAGGRHSPQQVQVGDICVGLTTRAYPISQVGSVSRNSNDLQSNITMTGFDDGCIGLWGNVHRPVSFSGSSDFILPPTSSSLLSNAPRGSQTPPFNSMAFPITLDTSFPMSDIHDHLTPNQSAPTESAGFGSFNNIAMWSGHLSPANDTSVVGHAAPCAMLSDNFDGNAMGIDVDNDNADAMEVDFLGSCTPHLQLGLQNSPLPPAMTMDHHCPEISWSHVGAPSSGVGLLFQNEANCYLGYQGHSAERLFHSFPSNQSLSNTSQQPYNSLSTIRDFVLHEDGLDPLALLPEQRKGLRNIEPKPTPSPSDAIRGSDSNIVTPQTPRKISRRRGPLNAEAREEALQVRKVRACAHCRRRKTKCSRGIVCNPCLRRYARYTFQGAACLRGPLDQFEEVFCPSFAFAHLSPLAINSWIKESGLVYIDNEVLVEVTTGPFLASMSFLVREIHMVNQDLLLLPDLTSESHDREQRFASIPTLGYALYDYGIDQVKPQCLDYIKTISKCPLHTLLNVIGNTSKIIWRSLGTIGNFLKANSIARQNRLLYKAVIFYWTLYAMGRSITFSDDSATTAVASLQNLSTILPSQPYVCARVLNRQIKGAMKSIYKEYLSEILEGLEREYRSRTRTSWAICFSTNVIVCMIAEQLQIVIDGLVIYNISWEGEDPVHAAKSGSECSQKLEEVLTEYMWPNFLAMYNPIKNECPKDDASGQSKGVADLVGNFRQITGDFEDEITNKTGDSCSGGPSKIIEDHKAFGVRNSARLVSKFLKTFYEAPCRRRNV